MRKVISHWLMCLPLLACFVSVATAHAEAHEISVKGTVDVKLDVAAGKAAVRNDAWKAAVVESKGGEWTLHEVDGRTLASASKNSAGDIELKDGAGKRAYSFKMSGETYRISDAEAKPVYRVKIKEDKFNVYDPSDKRILHGKQKDDGYGVRDDSDNQVLKVKGTKSLRETSLLSVPLEAQYRIVAWAAENL
ncbi:MAG: hypothetical protein U0136_17680 [Bdellovibrionota bacterium]